MFLPRACRLARHATGQGIYDGLHKCSVRLRCMCVRTVCLCAGVCILCMYAPRLYCMFVGMYVRTDLCVRLFMYLMSVLLLATVAGSATLL